MTLQDLLVKVEAAEGGSEALDWRIFGALNEHPYYLTATDSDLSELVAAAAEMNVDVPSYTTSLDAAIALVEAKLPGWDWRTGSETVDGLAILLSSTKVNTPALALIAALLRALISQEQPQ